MKRLWLLACLLVLAMTAVGTAQVDDQELRQVPFMHPSTFDFHGGGARAEGMGKAYLGLSDDASALTWNPAGLVGHERPILALSVRTATLGGQYSHLNKLGPTPDKFQYVSLDQSGTFNGFNFLSFISPVRIRGHEFVLSAAYVQTFEEFGSGYFDQNRPGIPHDFELLEDLFQYDYRAVATNSFHANPYLIAFGFGTPITPSIDFGASINIHTGKSVYQARVHQISDNYEALDRLLQEVHRDSIQTLLDTATYSGVNFTFGGKYRKDKLALGIVLRSGFSYNATVDRKFSDSVWYNGQIDHASTVYQDDRLLKYEIPWIFGLGGAYNLKENWLVAMDLEYRPFEGRKTKDRVEIILGSGGNNEETFEEMDLGWYNSFVVRTGTEYLWSTGSRVFPVVPLRFGLSYVPVPAPSLAFDGRRTKNTMYQISAGTGARWEQIWLDLAYVLTLRDQQGEAVFNDLVEFGEDSERTHRLNLTFTGYF